MTQTIDPIKLKAAAEHLEWVLSQYPDSEDVQGLLRTLLPLIQQAKAKDILQPIDSVEVPGSYNFGDGVYRDCLDPSVDDAYAAFVIELRGGLTERERYRQARLTAAWEQMKRGADNE